MLLLFTNINNTKLMILILITVIFQADLDISSIAAPSPLYTFSPIELTIRFSIDTVPILFHLAQWADTPYSKLLP